MVYPEWIIERAFGGTDVADTPGAKEKQSHWHEGASMPAAREACDLLVSACNDLAGAGTSTLLFLVGGAGNGKSHLARQVVESVRGCLRGHDGTHANRIYEIDLEGGSYLRVVNDATIPPAGQWESGGDALRADVEAALELGGHVLCCVNRGVLLRETGSNALEGSIGLAILSWLAGGGAQAPELPAGWKMTPEPADPARDHYSFAALANEDGRRIYLHVVFMDNASLLEPFAKTTGSTDPAQALKTSRRTVALIRKAPKTGSRMAAPAIQATVAAFSQSLPGPCEGAADLDPVRANASMLESPDVVLAWAGVARGAEVISGTHFTYRDIWGLVSLSLTGVLQGRTMQEHASWVSSRIAEFQEGKMAARLNAILMLATLRTHQTLFACMLPRGVCESRGFDQSYPSVQAMRSLAMADPVRELDAEVRRTVTEKMFLLEEDAKPGQTLAGQDGHFARCWTSFDQVLEDTIVAWLNGDELEDDAGGNSSRRDVARRRAVIAWYGEYVARLYSFSLGLPAFPLLVDLWQSTWTQASEDPNLDEDLEKGLLNLAFPAAGGKSLLPVFDERIVPTNESTSAGRILIQLRQKDYRVRASTQGDRIIVSLSHDQHSSEQKSLLLDFQLLRETMARNDGVGFTDAMFDVEPRVERLRAGGMMLEAAGDVQKVKKRLVFNVGDSLIPATGH